MLLDHLIIAPETRTAETNSHRGRIFRKAPTQAIQSLQVQILAIYTKHPSGHRHHLTPDHHSSVLQKIQHELGYHVEPLVVPRCGACNVQRAV